MTTTAHEPTQEFRSGDIRLLAHPVAQELLQARIPARLAYVALDGTPRVIAALFHWTGEEIVLASWTDDPKVAALQARPEVAITIDTNEFPFCVLSLRGRAEVTVIDGLPPETLPAFTRYFGPEIGAAQAERTLAMAPQQVRIAVRPAWVNVLDFQTRFPSGMAKRMHAG